MKSGQRDQEWTFVAVLSPMRNNSHSLEQNFTTSVLLYSLWMRLIRASKGAHHLNCILTLLLLTWARLTTCYGGIRSLGDPSRRTGHQVTCHNDHGCAGHWIAIR